MNKTSFRQLAITLLDDENGIPTKAYILLENMGREFEGCRDIFDIADCTNGHFYLPENHGLIA